MPRPIKMNLDRRSFMRGALMVGAASPLLLSAACSPASNTASGGGGANGGELNWLTWGDHFIPDQLEKVTASTKITGKPKLFADNADAFLQLKQTGGQFDLVSADALWVKKYMQSGLIEPFDMASIGASSELYSMAKNFEFFNDPKGSLGYPFGWSTIQMYYDPAKVTAPTSWDSLTDPAYKGKIVAQNIPGDLMAIAGIATGSKAPYALTPDQLSAAKGYLTDLKPNLIKMVDQNSEAMTMMANGEANIVIANLGTDVLVKNAGGPELKAVYPTEGTIGFIRT
jgi:putative spermidine/putrescine transport system substrate-binding protein